VSSVGEEVIVLPVGEPYEYDPSFAETTIVRCLVLYSEHPGSHAGDLHTFAVINLKPFAF